MDTISRTDRVRNEGEFAVYNKGGRGRPNAMIRRKANWTGYIVRRNCLLKRVIVGEVEGKGR